MPISKKPSRITRSGDVRHAAPGRTTWRVGLIGFPVEHSLSPALQQAAFDAAGIDAHYELWPTPDTDGCIAERVDSLRRPDVLGANITLPHKGAAYDLVDETTELAREARAVNTIINRAGWLIGDNTDIPGFLEPLAERGVSLPRTRAVVLGAGGAARGVLVALLSAGCTQISVFNRTPERAGTMISTLRQPVPIWSGPLDAGMAEWLPEATLLVNATSLGWREGELPLDRGLLATLPESALVFDLTYRDTPLLRMARELGLATLDGLEMLVRQGAESFRCWTGLEPPVDAMRAAALTARDVTRRH